MVFEFRMFHGFPGRIWVARRHVEDGQGVRAGDVLCEMEMEKACAEIEASHTGVVRWFVAPFVELEADQLICTIRAIESPPD